MTIEAMLNFYSNVDIDTDSNVTLGRTLNDKEEISVPEVVQSP